LSAIVSGSDRRLTEPVMAHVDPRVRAELERTARENERSVSAEVRVARRQHLATREGASH
jgi:hypothetical protein